MMSLDATLNALDAIAPLSLAADWDNVGLLVEPIGPDAPVRRIFLCIDLTEPVFAEAVADGADLIVAYHPIIFGGIKRLDRSVGIGRTLVDAVRAGIAIYCPHTAADATLGGVCDWLLGAVGPTVQQRAIEPTKDATDNRLGMGRHGLLSTPAPLSVLLPRIKKHLGLAQVRLAMSAEHGAGADIRTVAICPGAGGSLFSKIGDVDLLITGEMRHHDVLARVAAGTSVVLTEHTNCERGWLPILKAGLESRLGGRIAVVISARDRDPLRIA